MWQGTKLLAGTALATLLLAGCDPQPEGTNGGGSSTTNVSGVVAIGAPASGASVSFRCSGSTVPGVTTTANGRYAVSIPANAFPCAAQASGGTLGALALHSVIGGAGVTNITPLTDLITASAVAAANPGQLPATWFNGAANLAAVQAGLNAARAQLQTALTTAGFTLPAGFNPLNAPFTATLADPYDQVLEALAAAIAAAPTLNTYPQRVNAWGNGTLTTLPPPPAPATGCTTGGADNVLAFRGVDTLCAFTRATSSENGNTTTFVAANGHTLSVARSGSTVVAVTLTAGSSVYTCTGCTGVTQAESSNAREFIFANTTLTGTTGTLTVLAGSQIHPLATTQTPLQQLQAVAGSYDFDIKAVLTGVGDLTLTPRGIRADDPDGYPSCEALGVPGTASFGNTSPWQARVTVNSNGSVTVQNADDLAQSITLTPGSATNDVTAVSAAQFSSTWKLMNPAGSEVQIVRAITFNDGIHPQPITERFTITLGLLGGDVRHVGMQGPIASDRMAFCSLDMTPTPADVLAPVKALAGNYTLQHNYTGQAAGWTTLDIGSNGSLTFNGSGPSLSPAQIRRVAISRRNDNNFSADSSLWAMTLHTGLDLNGDSSTGGARDIVQLVLDDDGSLRDVIHTTASNQVVEVSVQTPALPAFDDTLAAALTGNGASGKVDGVAQLVSSTQADSRVEITAAGRLDFFAGRNHFLNVPQNERKAWRITVNDTTLETNVPYPCTNGDIGVVSQGSAVLFDDSTGILTSANSGFAVQPALSSRAGGACEVVLSQVNYNGSGILTGVVGKYRALVWDRNNKRYLPATGYFRFLP